MSRRSPHIAAILSAAVPGLGQWYNAERPKGLALLCMTLGIWFGLATGLHSWVTVVMLVVVYVFVWIPATVDAYQRAAGHSSSLLSGERRWYTVLMLLAVGPMALPLLWQGARFSRMAKVLWTVVVIVIALAGVFVLTVLGPALERILGTVSDVPRPGP